MLVCKISIECGGLAALMPISPNNESRRLIAVEVVARTLACRSRARA